MSPAPRLPVIWTRQATRDLAGAHAYIARDSLAAADRQGFMIFHAAESLSHFPQKGRSGRIDGTCELVVVGTSYIVAYRLRDGSVRILAILHRARRWPDDFAAP